MLYVEIRGNQRAITANGLRIVLDTTLQMLAEIDAGLSGREEGTTDWLIDQVHNGSIRLDLAPRPRTSGHDYGSEIGHAYVLGLDALEHDGASPPFLSELGLKCARRLVRLVGVEGIDGLHVADDQVATELTASASLNADRLLHPGRQAIGSVEGKLETISRQGRTRFVVYEELTHKVVVCRMDSEESAEMAKQALGRRVNVAGVVHYNLRGEPRRVQVETIRVLHTNKQLPSLVGLTGSDPDITGTASTADYLRAIRG